MSSVRLRRLQADFEKLSAYAQRHPRVRLVQVEGQPPEKYQVEFQLRSLQQKDDQLAPISRHLVEISLPRNYPRMPPQCRMLTPVFHPNIAPHAICIGDHWNAGEPLWSMVMRIGEMLAYQSYNTKSPLNGEAARWVDENEESLPLDRVPLYVDQPQKRAAPTGSAPAGTGSVPTAKVVRPGAPAAPSAGKNPAATRTSTAKEVPAARVVRKAPPAAAPASTGSSPQTGPSTARVAKKSPTPTAPPSRKVKPQTEVPAARVVAKAPASGSSAAARPKPPVEKIGQVSGTIACICPGCEAAYNVPVAMAGKNARCKKCRTIITIPAK